MRSSSLSAVFISIFSLFMISTNAYAVPHVFTNGQVADANDINANFNSLHAADNIIQYQIVSGNTLLSSQSRLIVINSGNNIKMTLPEANTVPGRAYQIYKLEGFGVIDLSVASGNISGPFSDFRIKDAGKSELFSDGSAWRMLSGTGDFIHPLSKGYGILADIAADSSSSSPQYFTEFNGKVYFAADDITNGRELWVSDGTAAGTTMVKDIYVGSSGSSPYGFIVFGSELYFRASDSANGSELWKTDGTTAGTVLVKDIRVGTSGSSPTYMTIMGSHLYFYANDGTTGNELWKSDGTTTGTNLIKDIRVGINSSSPSYLTVLGSNLYFVANDGGTYGNELWKSDGTTAGTNLLKDIQVGSGHGSPSNITEHNGDLYFTANDGTTGTELWKSDGTTAGTNLLKDIYVGTNSSSPNYFTSVGNILYFSAQSATDGHEPWITDGTTAGTNLLVDLVPGSGGSYVYGFAPAGQNVIMYAAGPQKVYAYNGTFATEIWSGQVTNIKQNTYNSDYFLPFQGGVLYYGYLSPNWNLYWTDGTSSGTVAITDTSINTNSNSIVIGDKVYISMQDNNNSWGLELYILGGATPPPEPIAP